MQLLPRLPIDKRVIYSNDFEDTFDCFCCSIPYGWSLDLIKKYHDIYDRHKMSYIDILRIIGHNGLGNLKYGEDEKKVKYFKISDLCNLNKDLASINKHMCPGLISDYIQYSRYIGGFHPKVVYKDDSESEWILKIADSNNSGVKEYNYTLLAKKCGIDCVDFKLINNQFFASKRFDRDGDMCVHTLNSEGIMGREYKLSQLIRYVLQNFHNGENQALEIIRRYFFCIILGIKDFHSKNTSFIYDGIWKIAPMYDIIPTNDLTLNDIFVHHIAIETLDKFSTHIGISRDKIVNEYFSIKENITKINLQFG